MLGTFRESSLACVDSLKKAYNVFLLSNTNVIHYEAVLQIYDRQFGNCNLAGHFHKTYFSHLIHQRKPDVAAYALILKENNLGPGETLFIDDTYKNLPPAQSLGLQILYIEADKKPVEDALAALLGAT